MKRLFLLLLTALLLAGCGAQTIPGEDEENNAPGIYVPNSPIEQQTAGALRAYPLGGDGYTWIAVMGSGLLVGADTAQTQLTALSGENCTKVASIAAPAGFTAGSMGFSVTDFGVGYYTATDHTVVFLNKLLQQTHAYALPADLQGLPAVTSETEEIYYCVGQELKGFDPSTGITRLIKTQSGETQTLVGSYFGGKILACKLTDDSGQERVVYISTENGQTVSDDQGLSELHTYEDRYFARRMDGTVAQNIYGTLDAPGGIFMATEEKALVPAPALNGALEYQEDSQGLHLTFCDFTTGLHTAEVEVTGITDATAFTADAKKQCIWFLGTESTYEGQVLYRWDLSKSPLTEETVYTAALYTAQSPDTQGLEQCQSRVDALNDQYGVQIRIWKDAVQETGDHEIVAEYQVDTIQGMLDQLEPVLALFPEGFLKETSDALCINLVRSISREKTAVQYWDGGKPHIALAAGGDIYDGFLRNIGYVVDAHVLGNTVAYDYWNERNPPGFTYDYDYVANAQREDTTYLEGSKRAFADKLAMSFPTEDRNSLFYHAMLADNADCFAGRYMQDKLEYLCQAIRKAYDLKKDPTVFPWEQYLQD